MYTGAITQYQPARWPMDHPIFGRPKQGLHEHYIRICCCYRNLLSAERDFKIFRRALQVSGTPFRPSLQVMSRFIHVDVIGF
jgi:hypothetical protein